MNALLALNFTVALMALAVGGHAVDYALNGAADAASRVSAFELAAQVHAACAAALLAVWQLLRATRPAWAIWIVLAGLAAFALALYGYGTLGWKAAMPLTVIGTLLMGLGWLSITLLLLKHP
ncbi:MAG: DUF423 domain-containing protein [Pseudomonadota bacterium]